MPPMLRQCATTAITAVHTAPITFAMAAMLGRLVAQLKMPRLDAYAEVPIVDLKALHAKIGQLALENDFLEGALSKAGLLSAKR
jgi:tRNA (Thr-GGU) A37 N-methylase